MKENQIIGIIIGIDFKTKYFFISQTSASFKHLQVVQ
jgi:hypothetical protein